MNKSEIAKVIARENKELAVLPGLVFFRPILELSEARTLYELFMVMNDVSLSEFSPYAMLLLKPDPKLKYEQYNEKVNEEAKVDVTRDEYDELKEYGLSPIDIVYHYVIYRLIEEGLVNKDTLIASDSSKLNTRLDEFVFSENINEIPLLPLPGNFVLDIETLRDYMLEYKRKLSDFIKELEKEDKPMEEIKDIELKLKPVLSTVIKSFLVFRNETVKDSLEHFNDARVSYRLPYVTVSPYTKISQSATVYNEWNVSTPDSLIGYIRTKDSETLKSYSQFELRGDTLTIESRKKEDVEAAQPAEDLVSKIEEAIGIRVGRELLQQEVSVEYFFAGIDVNQWSFKHFLYTDPVMKNFYYMDEFNQLEKKKQAITLYYYESRTALPVVLSISNREAQDKNVPHFEAGRCHLRVYVKRCTKDKLESIMENVVRCLQKYGEARMAIEEELKRIVGKELTAEYTKMCVKKVRDEKIEYTSIITSESVRAVQTSLKPIVLKDPPPGSYVINPEDSDKVPANPSKDNSKQVLAFPKRSDRELLEPYYYSCKAPYYISLRETVPSERYQLDYIPVCLTENNFDANAYEKAKKDESYDLKKNTDLMTYLLDIEQEEQEPSSYVITKTALVDKGRYGEMMMDKWLRFVLPVDKLYRYGLYNFTRPRIKSSYIPKGLHGASVLYILHSATSDIPINIEEVKDRVLRYIDQSVSYYSDTYGYSVEELKRIVQENEYIDPRLFYNILREVFSVEILLFTKETNANETPFYPICPYYQTSPIQSNQRFSKMVMIALNKGGEFDLLVNPLCEVIRINRDGPLLYDITDEYEIFYNEYNRALKELYGMEFVTHDFTGKPTGQTLDTFQKVKWLHFESVSVMLVTPIHSMDIVIVPERNFVNDVENVLSFIDQAVKKDQFTLSYEEDTLGRVHAIRVVYKDRSYLFPIETQEHSPSYRVYQNLEKTARYLTEYTFLSYSIACRDEEIDFVTFYENNFVIDPEHLYPLVDRQWEERNREYLTEDNRVIIQNQTVRVKLMYLLRQKYRLNRDLLLAYRTLDYMPNYYSSLSDFQQYPGAIIFDRSFTKPKEEIGSLVVQPKVDKPYILYKNIAETGHKKWLCYPARSKAHALWVCKYWETEGCVPLPEDDGENDSPHTELVWANENAYVARLADSTKYIVSVFYLDSGETRYQALLPYRLW
jgi:hypothetical protein